MCVLYFLEHHEQMSNQCWNNSEQSCILYKAGETVKGIAKAIRGKSASENLFEEELVKFYARVGIQMEVV
jgi:hypothetical protein